jgi:starvation-inducible DNA-binding protein
MSKLYPTKNDLARDIRKPMVDLLNDNLATAVDLSLQAKLAHWNVKGPSFMPLHELFDKLHEEAGEWVDDIAERAVQLGGVAEATLEVLPDYSLALSSGRDHVEAVSRALATFGASVRSAIDRADQAGDMDTADLFTEVSRGVDKMLWFVEAHLQAEGER